MSWGRGEFQKTYATPSDSVSLCLVAMSPDVSFQLLFHCHTCLPAAMRIAMMIMEDSNPLKL